MSEEAEALSLVGHDEVFSFFANSFKLERLCHAYLLCGAPGIGKRRVARELAKVLHCHSPTEEFKPCRECSACEAFDEGQNPHHAEIRFDREQRKLNLVRRKRGKMIEWVEESPKTEEKKGTAGSAVDRVRAFIQELQGSRDVGQRWTYLLPNFESYSPQVQNAMLKTLEEPPEGVLFILTTDRPSGVLETIHSRAQVLQLSPLSRKDLMRLVPDESFSTGEIDILLDLAEGRADLLEKFQQQGYHEFQEWCEAILLKPGNDFIQVAQVFMDLVKKLEVPPDEDNDRPRAKEGIVIFERLLLRKLQYRCRYHFVAMQILNTTVEELAGLRRDIENSGHLMLSVEHYFQQTLIRYDQIQKYASLPETA